MKTPRLSAAFLAALVFVSAPAVAAWIDIPATDFRLSPPPAPGSAASDLDYAALLQLQADRTPQDCAVAAGQKIPDFHSLYDGSGLLSKPELAAVAPFLDEASQYMSKVSGYFKKKFARPRPYDVDTRVQPCVEKPGGATSYPSTHAASGALDACVLGRIFPDRADALASYGKHLGDLRAIVGVHHPSDVSAGQSLADQVCARLLQEADFRAELTQVQASLPAR